MTLYTVQKTRLGDDKPYGPTHGSHYAEITSCEQLIDSHWSIINNTFDGVITCKQCIAALAKEVHNK